MIGHGIDSVLPIGSGTMDKVLDSLPISWVGWHLNTWGRQPSKWTRGHLKALASLGVGNLPVFASPSAVSVIGFADMLTAEQARDDAAECAVRLGKLGILPGNGHPVAVAVEVGTHWLSPAGYCEYATSWAASIAELGYLPTLRGDSSFLWDVQALITLECQYWAARWDFGDFVGGLSARSLLRSDCLGQHNGRIIWQYAGPHKLGSTDGGYGWNVADARWVPAEVML